MIEFILGGARSGKSRFAENRALDSAMPVTCIVTAEANDAEMQRRIEHHRQQRPAEWKVIEEPLYLAQALQTNARPDGCIIVDCMTLWLTNLLCQGKGFAQAEADLPLQCELLNQQQQALFTTLEKLPGKIILISNEIGMGIVPLGASNRLFMDEQGRLNQTIATLSDKVTLVAAGLPLILKNSK